MRSVFFQKAGKRVRVSLHNMHQSKLDTIKRSGWDFGPLQKGLAGLLETPQLTARPPQLRRRRPPPPRPPPPRCPRQSLPAGRVGSSNGCPSDSLPLCV